jgi:hypothetical protein
MKHIPNTSQTHMPVIDIRHDESGATADDCIACHIRAAYNMLNRPMEILWALRLSKWRKCHAAGKCNDTGLAIIAGDEPPSLKTCECFLTSNIGDKVLDTIGTHLELMLPEVDRLERMVDRHAESSASSTTANAESFAEKSAVLHPWERLQ